ncbi:hypothetical protein AGOR_G00187960 [Albula goreensis]|uniref:Gelsolin-like domain-containing protein n=1 Tax=Albula goreensis TaxID=1534307 RepID=A0A8T3CUI7_9TELE|nr:hypothetical protein AGOR_G00187960 [Albula goreensis]
MDTMESPALESKAERIARYKAERRRELAERYGNVEELPSKYVRRDRRGVSDGLPLSQQDALANVSTPPVTNRTLSRESRAYRRLQVSAADTPLEDSGGDASLGGTTSAPASELLSPKISNGTELDSQMNRQWSQAAPGLCSGAGAGDALSHDALQLHTRVSVGQLRSALLQQTAAGMPGEKASDGGSVTSTLDLAVRPGSEGRRRTRRYLPGGAAGGRKTNERFRTQPVTASEVQDSGGVVGEEDGDKPKVDVKTDDRANLSVAAKMSMFKELEKTAAPEASSFLKPRTGTGVYERRSRHANDHRALTQPITTEEMVEAISLPKPLGPSEAPGQAEQDGPEEAKPEGEDESSKLTLTEKLALFNKLAQPESKVDPTPAEAPEKRRQKGARYRTQPITLDEVKLLQRGALQLPPLRLSAQISDRQQTQSVNLKPSEIRQSPDWEEPDLPCPAQPCPQQLNSEPVEIRGILKKSRAEVLETDQGSRNGESYQTDTCVATGQQEAPGSPEGTGKDPGVCSSIPATHQESTVGASSNGGAPPPVPWRRRNRSRTCTPSFREPITTACRPPEENLSEEKPPVMSEEGGKTDSSPHPCSSLKDRMADSQSDEKELKNCLKNSEVSNLVQEAVADHCNQQVAEISSTNKAENEISHDAADHAVCWEPVFSSLFVPASPTSQYVLCYNQNTLSYEAQEVTEGSSPTPWRQKRAAVEVETKVSLAERRLVLQEEEWKARGHSAMEEICSHRDVEAEGEKGLEKLESCLDSAASGHGKSSIQVTAETVKEVISLDGGFYSSSTSVRSSCSSTIEQDFSCILQSTTPTLTSSVAEHKRAVRPARKTQGSRNPLRVLAAREDIRQEYTEQRVSITSMEYSQTQDETLGGLANRENASNGNLHGVTSNELLTNNSFPPYSKLMLIHIKGRQNVQVRLVEPTARSLNSGDCFLLVTPTHCFLWIGQFANLTERAKASEMASFMQAKQDLGCKAPQVTILEEGSEAVEFWDLLGGKAEYRGAGDVAEDELFEGGVVESNCVYRLVEDRLVPHDEGWASIPSTALLQSTEVLLFDFGSEVYVWLGKDVPQSHRKVALQLGRQVWGGPYDYSNCRVNPLNPSACSAEIHKKGDGRPSWALFACLSEQDETALFREKFLDWTERGGTKEAAPVEEVKSPVPAAPAEAELQPCDARALLEGSGGPVGTLLGAWTCRGGAAW